jgi:hypothetical protein
MATYLKGNPKEMKETKNEPDKVIGKSAGELICQNRGWSHTTQLLSLLAELHQFDTITQNLVVLENVASRRNVQFHSQLWGTCLELSSGNGLVPSFRERGCL